MWSFQFGITVLKKVIGQFELLPSIVISKAVSERNTLCSRVEEKLELTTHDQGFGMPGR